MRWGVRMSRNVTCSNSPRLLGRRASLNLPSIVHAQDPQQAILENDPFFTVVHDAQQLVFRHAIQPVLIGKKVEGRNEDPLWCVSNDRFRRSPPWFEGHDESEEETGERRVVRDSSSRPQSNSPAV